MLTLLTRMDLLNYQFLDKMNNNIGRLSIHYEATHYEDESGLTGEYRMQSLSSAMGSTRTGPPPISPSKRKYIGEQMEDHIDCDNEHMTKMSRSFASHIGKTANGDNSQDPWNNCHSPFKNTTSSINGLDGSHLYAPLPIFAMDQPLALTKNNMDTAVIAAPPAISPTERQQNRPSVITCAPPSNRTCNLSDCISSFANTRSKTNVNTACDPVIEEHFRRSLGKIYKEPEPVSDSVSISGSVDDHFAKALGETWHQIQSKGSGSRSPESSS